MTIKKDEVSRSQLIRDYLKTCKNRKQKNPKAVCEALAKQGVNVSSGLVSVVKASMKRSIRKRAAKIAANARYSKKNVQTSNKKIARNKTEISVLFCAKQLLDFVGGDIQKAKKNLEIVSKLIS
jgi:hypothetical protein